MARGTTTNASSGDTPVKTDTAAVADPCKRFPKGSLKYIACMAAKATNRRAEEQSIVTRDTSPTSRPRVDKEGVVHTSTGRYKGNLRDRDRDASTETGDEFFLDDFFRKKEENPDDIFNKTVKGFRIGGVSTTVKRSKGVSTPVVQETNFISFIPMQISSLASTNATLPDFDSFAGEAGNYAVNLNYGTINKIEVLVGYGSNTYRDEKGNVKTNRFIKDSVWTPLTKGVFDSVTSRPVLCRMKVYENKMLGIERDTETQLPTYSEYFLLSPNSEDEENSVTGMSRMLAMQAANGIAPTTKKIGISNVRIKKQAVIEQQDVGDVEGDVRYAGQSISGDRIERTETVTKGGMIAADISKDDATKAVGAFKNIGLKGRLEERANDLPVGRARGDGVKRGGPRGTPGKAQKGSLLDIDRGLSGEGTKGRMNVGNRGLSGENVKGHMNSAGGLSTNTKTLNILTKTMKLSDDIEAGTGTKTGGIKSSTFLKFGDE